MRTVRSWFTDVTRHPLRNILSGVAMVVGVVGLVAAVAVGDVITDMLVAREEQTTARATTYDSPLDVPAAQLGSVADALTARFDPALMAHLDGALVNLETSLAWTTAENLGDMAASPSVTTDWAEGDLLAVRRVPVISGSFPSLDSAFPPVLALNEAAARQAGYPSVSTVKLSQGGGWRAFRVVAVIADGSGDPRAYGSLAAYEALFGCQGTCQVDLRLTVHGVGLDTVKQAVNDVLTDLNDPAITTMHDPMRYDTAWTVADQTRVLSLVFGWVAGIMLVIAAIGIVNVGLSSLRERAGELVVRRAVGATRWDVFAFVMGAALVTAVVVAAIALALAVVGVYVALPRMIPAASAIAHPGFPWRPCLAGLAAAVLTAMVGSLAPAIKAARLPVALALRT